MFTKLHIKNYKSIHDLEIELGRVNVFIGENGCGKSNILEGVALLSTAKEGRLRLDDLADKGIRVANHNMMVNAFEEDDFKREMDISLEHSSEEKLYSTIKEASNREYQDSSDQGAILNPILSSPSLVSFENELRKLINKEGLEQIPHDIVEYSKRMHYFTSFTIYEIQTNPLRGFSKETYEIPGRNGENLYQLLEEFTNKQWEQLHQYNKFISWLDDEGIIIDREDKFLRDGLRLRSNSKLYLKDRFMAENKNIFSVENANEGALHILFYLALLISDKTPPFFAIDNIENALNPYLCRVLTKTIVELSKENNKQSLITTHNPAVLDGLNLHDDEQRLFVVSRNANGHTRVKRIKLKPDVKINNQRLKLSELWMRGHLGGISTKF